MIYLIIFVIFSYLLDGFISMIIPINNIYLYKSFFSLISIIVIYPYFTYDKKQFIIITFILGLLYDLVYTNTFMLNAIIFTVISLLTIELYKILRNNIINGIIICIIDLFLYNTIVYIILKIFNVRTIPISLFLSNLLFIILINILYFSITYVLIKRFQKQLKVKCIV